MSRVNHIEQVEKWRREQIALARAILSGEMRFLPGDCEFYERWAKRRLEFEGLGTGQADDPAPVAREKSGQGRLF